MIWSVLLVVVVVVVATVVIITREMLWRDRQDAWNAGVKCCEHNPCPSRPKLDLGNYRDRPWRCRQCGTWWIRKFGQGGWGWKKLDTVPAVDTWKSDGGRR